MRQGFSSVSLLFSRPHGIKIQGVWVASIYKIVEFQDNPHTSEPVNSGPMKKVHRINRRSCIIPVPDPSRAAGSAPKSTPVCSSEVTPEHLDLDPDYVVQEDFTNPCLD